MGGMTMRKKMNEMMMKACTQRVEMTMTPKTLKKCNPFSRFATLLLFALLLNGLFLAVPHKAQAWPAKYTSCASCHAATEPTASVSIALNGVAGNTITVAPGNSFELDYKVLNIAGSGVLGFEVALPAGWMIGSGTSNTPAIAGWNSVWDATSGVPAGWATANMYSTAGEFPTSPDGYTINFDATGWDSGNRNAAFDDASGADLDGTANTMGTDATITVPGGTGNGNYTIVVNGIGHNVGGTKANVGAVITVTVSSGGDGTAPTEVAASLNVTPQSSTYVGSPASISMQFNDAESAVTACEYTLDGTFPGTAGVITGAGPYTCTASGVVVANSVSYTIQMRAQSGGGWSTPVQALNRTGDTLAPSTTDNAPAGWVNVDQSVALTPNDGGSGVASTDWCVDDLNTCTPGVDGTSFGTGTTVNVTQTAGNHSTQFVRYQSTDGIGTVETIKNSAVSIDKEVPTDGVLTLTPADLQMGLTWDPATEGNALASPAYIVVANDNNATPPLTCTNPVDYDRVVYTGDATSTTDLSLTNGVDYAYRVCATDVGGNVSTGTTNNAQPAAVCSYAAPTITIDTFNQQIVTDGGNVSYTVSVTNNDAAICGSTAFNLTAIDSNGAEFSATSFGTNPLNVTGGATVQTTLIVTDNAGGNNHVTNDTYFYTGADGNHAQSANSNTVTSYINVPGSNTTSYTAGEMVHIEFRTNTRMASSGATALTISQSDNTLALNGATMLELQQGAQWIYVYDWDSTASPADTYRVEVYDLGDTTPLIESIMVLGNPTVQINTFVDAGYTSPSDTFADGASVYVEIITGSNETGITESLVESWYGGSWATGGSITQTGTNFRYNFVVDFASAGIANGDWGWLYFDGAVSSTFLHRPIQRNDAGCGSCTYTDPTVAVVTANQEINSDSGTVDYTINVTNNDSVACGPTSFDLFLSDTNATEFLASTFGVDPLAVSPGVTGSTTITVAAQTGFTSATNDTSFYTVADVNHGQSVTAGPITTTLNVIDLVAPTVDSFSVPANSTTQTVPISVFTASDAVGVTGYMITETPVAPLAGDAGWQGSAPVSFLVSSGDGPYTLYAWAKDAQGNVSTSLSAPVNVDSAVPTVTAFTVPTPQGSTTVSVTTLTASDNIGVTGYLITENVTPPLPGAAGWTGIAPGSYTVSSGDGPYTLYAWAKDAVGNVSAALTAPVTVDTTAPAIFSTVPVDAAPAAPLNGSVTITWGENIDCTTVNTTNVTSTSPGWSLFSCSTDTAVFNSSLQSYTTLYTVNVTTNVRDLTGNPMAALYSFSYTTQAEACTYSDPTISIIEANQDVTVDDGFVDYTVNIVNNDTGSCGNTLFTVLATENPGTADFTESFPGGATTSLAPGANGNVTLRTTATSAVLNGVTQILDIKTDGSADVNHNDSNQVSRTTTMNTPCNVAPTTSFVTANQQVTTDGGSAAYTVQVQNDNPAACGATAFDLVVVDDNAAAFTIPSVFTVDPLTVNPGGATNTTTLTVTSQTGAANGAANNSYFYTAVNGTIPQSGNSATRTTTINRPCAPAAPSFSHAVNRNIAPDGSAIYDLTIINNDVDCAASLFTFSIDSEVESNVGTFTLPSVFSAPTVSVASGTANSTVTFTVTGNNTGVELDTLTSTIRIADGSHVDQTTTPVTTIKPFDPLIHSSASTGSTKHSGVGGWGVANARYGEFTCATCHTPSTTNIKRIRTVLPNAPDISKGNFPGAGGAISFLDAAEPTTDFGDDTAAPRASSTRVCEVCHTYDATKANGVVFHAYDQQVAAGHEDGKDCTSCHKHNDGFSKAGATCDSCHGYPPSPGDASVTPVRVDDGFGYQAVEGKGSHVEHVNHLAALAGVTLDPNSDSYGNGSVAMVCGVCHDMNGATHEMGGGAGANRNINFNNSTTFQFGPSAPVYTGVEDDPSTTTPKTCSNINCHYQATPWWE
jgi:hypothetical protein